MNIENINENIPNINSRMFYYEQNENATTSSYCCFFIPWSFCTTLVTLPFLPCIWVGRLLLPINLINGILAYVKAFKDQLCCVFESACQPLKCGKWGLKCVFNLLLIGLAVFTAFSLAFVQYGTFYYLSIPKTELIQDLQFAPLSVAGGAGKQVQHSVYG